MNAALVLELVAIPLVWLGSIGRWRLLRRRGVVSGPRESDVSVTVGFVVIMLGVTVQHWHDSVIAAAFLPMALVSVYALGIRRGSERSAVETG